MPRKREKTSGRAVKSAQRKPSPSEVPEFCDYSCPHASFPAVDAVGACRREVGVYCTLMGRYNNKNAGCLARGRQGLI